MPKEPTPAERRSWACLACGWTERAHPTYGWASHNARAVEVHRTNLCVALRPSSGGVAVRG